MITIEDLDEFDPNFSQKEHEIFENWGVQHYETNESFFLENEDNNGDLDEMYDWCREHFDEITTGLHELAQENLEMCKTCEHCEATKDAYSTGDSPTLYECTTVEPTLCPYVLENLDETTEQGGL